MPYKVISDNCVLRGKLRPIGSTIADAEIVECCASALIALKQIEPVVTQPAAAKAAAKEQSSN